jgi:hypothetical protein
MIFREVRELVFDQSRAEKSPLNKNSNHHRGYTIEPTAIQTVAAEIRRMADQSKSP